MKGGGGIYLIHSGMGGGGDERGWGLIGMGGVEKGDELKRGRN